MYPTAEQVFTHYADILPRSAEFGVDHADVVARDLAVWFGPGATARLTPSLDPGGSPQ